LLATAVDELEATLAGDTFAIIMANGLITAAFAQGASTNLDWRLAELLAS
jgi:hypothetical protein